MLNEDIPNILIVDDDQMVLDSFSACFSSMGYKSIGIANPTETVEVLKKNEFDLIYLDLQMKPYNGFQVLDDIKAINPNTTVIIISGFGDMDDAIEAVDKGAYHIIKKPIDFKDLQFFTKKALEFHKIKSELNKLREEVKSHIHQDRFITKNPNYLNIIDLARKIADSDIQVLITGESGTGKELMADFLHENSPRANSNFIKVNCSSIPEDLLESELFGESKNNSQEENKVGKFQLANGGTIFLDEIGELPLNIQVKILNILETKEISSGLDSETQKIDVRVIASTNINLEEAVKEKTFREDLFYLLNGANLKLIPLRERPEDISLLIHHFLEVYSYGNKIPEISSDAMGYLKAYRWSGNVRELQNVIHRSVVLSRNDKILPNHLPVEITSSGHKNEELISLEELEKIHIKKVLQLSSDYKEAAKILGIDLTTLWRKRKKYSIL